MRLQSNPRSRGELCVRCRPQVCVQLSLPEFAVADDSAKPPGVGRGNPPPHKPRTPDGATLRLQRTRERCRPDTSRLNGARNPLPPGADAPPPRRDAPAGLGCVHRTLTMSPHKGRRHKQYANTSRALFLLFGFEDAVGLFEEGCHGAVVAYDKLDADTSDALQIEFVIAVGDQLEWRLAGDAGDERIALET